MAALIVRWNYTEVLDKVDPGLHHQDARASSPPCRATERCPVGTWGAFRDQIIGTAILMLLILAVTDLRNNAPAANLGPFIIGLLVVGIGMAWGTNAGYAINPARDFGPRLASFLTGYEDGLARISTAISTSGCRSSAPIIGGADRRGPLPGCWSAGFLPAATRNPRRRAGSPHRRGADRQPDPAAAQAHREEEDHPWLTSSAPSTRAPRAPAS